MSAEGIMRELARDNASLCGTATSWGGAGAIAIAPAAVPSGGAGYLSVTFCRTNQTNSIIARDENGSMRLIHGWKGEEGSKLKQSSRFDGIPNQASVP
jgi:hypothetical protein